MHFLANLVLSVLVAGVVLALFSTLVAYAVERYFVPPGDWLEVDGERIHYRSLGQGPAIVLVHGLAGQMMNFDYLPLEQLAQRWRLILLDRPGSGRSPRRDEGKAGVTAQAQLVAGFIQALQLPQPPLLVGHSLGGAIALGVALRDPQCIAGLALIAPLTHFSPHVPAPFRALTIRTPWLRRLFGHVLAVPLVIAIGRPMLAAVFGPEPTPRDFEVRGGGLLSLRPSAYFGASADLHGIEADLPAQQQRYGELRLPLRILYGDRDQVLDWRAQGEALRARVPQAELQLVPGAGHMLPVTQVAATTAWLEEAARAMCAGIGQHPGQ
jgi:pimeloyl-ACP methyl ester carboxylesterase